MPEADAVTKTEKSGWGLWQQVMVVGVGTCAFAYVLPQIMEAGKEDRKFINDKYITTSEKTITTTAENTATTKLLIGKVDDQTNQIEKLADRVDETNDILKPLVKELGNAATAMKEQNEQAEADQ